MFASNLQLCSFLLFLLCAYLFTHYIPQKSAQSIFVSNVLDHVSLRYVADSAVCETTPGVQQISGYIDVGSNMSMWFWFFAARESPKTAPFTLWLNGGPGCSSMIGLFQENGPCSVNPDNKTTTLNPYSWNNISNIIYIDQPIGAGFSYGDITINSTEAAAPVVWKAFQILFESGQFKEFQSRELIFATESYGGHYGPSFVTYFDEQNAKIQNGSIKGEMVVVSALMINNGWYDPLIQNQAFVDFATNAPGYGPLQNSTVLEQMSDAYYGPGGCKVQLEACYAAGNSTASNKICLDADGFCDKNLGQPSAFGRNEYDLRQTTPPFSPRDFYIDFLGQDSIQQKIGAESPFVQCSDKSSELFNRTGDDARTVLPQLGTLANSGLKILIWAGDADINCNWVGGYASVLAMDWYGQAALRVAPFSYMTVGGKAVAEYKNVGNFSFARVYNAGHEVPYFQPNASFEIFKQILQLQPLHSV